MESSIDRELLTVGEMAAQLKVPVSWLYSRTRKRGPGSIPVIRVGKYCRFNPADVLAWIKGKGKDDEAE